MIASPMVGRVLRRPRRPRRGWPGPAVGDPWTVLRAPGDELDVLEARDRVALETFAAWFAAERDSAARRSVEDLIDRALRAHRV